MKKTLIKVSALLGLTALFASVSMAATTVPVQLISPTGSTSGQVILSSGATNPPGWGSLALGNLPAITASSVIGNSSASSAAPSALSIPSCSASGSALTWVSGTGFACATGLGLTANPLSQFAATTSAQLAGVISDETGTGSLVFSASPSLTGTPLAPTAAATTNTTQIATTAFVASETLNALQTFTTETGSRLSGTTYTNSTGRPIVVYVSGATTAANGSMFATINGNSNVLVITQPVNAVGIGISIVIPAGATYSITAAGSTISAWFELR